jgi:hypothetical protein
MDLGTFMRDANYFKGQFRPFGQSGYMVAHTSPAKDMPGGLCRALSCAFVTYNYGKDDNLPFWLNSDLFASPRFFSALGAKQANLAGEYAMFVKGEKEAKLHDDLTTWQAKFQAQGAIEEEEWKHQIKNTLDLVSKQFLTRPLRVIGSTISTKANKHSEMTPLLRTAPGFFLHSPGGHHMCASVVRENRSKFFDPNFGQVKFADVKQFSLFVRTYYNRDAYQASSFSCGSGD